ncbi:fucolectin-like isoform X2 [Acanthaster planci]|nr:fucolectin-like isoform X2 [Acanthaster planci]
MVFQWLLVLALILADRCQCVPGRFTAISVSGSSTSQSSTCEEGCAAYAVDGLSDTFQCSRPDGSDKNPWWRLDLLASYNVGQIKVTSRYSPGRDYFAGTEARTGLSTLVSFHNRCGSPVSSSYPGEVHVFLCDSSEEARFVSLVKDVSTSNGTFLSVAEVTVDMFEPGKPVIKDCRPAWKPATFRLLHQDGLISNPSQLLATVAAGTPQFCALRCLNKAGCLSFDIAPGKQCRLYNIHSADINAVRNSDSAVYACLFCG